TLSETATISGAASRACAGFRTTWENLATTISHDLSKNTCRSESHVAAIADSVSKGAGKFPLESLVPSDVVGRAFAGARAISDNSVSAMRSGERRVGNGFRSQCERQPSAKAGSAREAGAKSRPARAGRPD